MRKRCASRTFLLEGVCPAMERHCAALHVGPGETAKWFPHQKKKKKLKGIHINNIVKQFKNDLIYTIALLVAAFWPFIPRRPGLALFAFLGRVFSMLPTKDRTWCRDHFRLVFGAKLSEKEINNNVRGMYEQLGKNLFDALYLSRKTKAQLDGYVKSDDLTPVWDAYNAKRGVLTITAHTGCFEMLLHYFAAQGFGCFAIGRELYDRRIDDLIKKQRSGENIVYLHRNENLRKFLKLLAEGRLFGVLVDQDTNVDGVFAHFLGKLAYTPSGAVKLAMRYGLPVFVITTARDTNDIHRIFVRPIPLASGGTFDHDLVTNVERINEAIGETIKAYPQQWVWMHRRWKRKPTDKGYENVPNIETMKG
jgi:Kdo2-lipid IVA lauroyltransferase/acyltransferase